MTTAAVALAEKEAPSAEVQPVKVQVDYVRPWHYPQQTAAIFDPLDRDGNPARYSFIEASTKAGKTRGCISWLAEQAILTGAVGRNYWWVAPVHPQAEIAYRRMKRGLRGFIRKSNDTNGFLVLFNGAVIWFKSGEKPDNLYGEDVWAAVIDEASRVREEAFSAIRSTLTATNGPLRCIGNVKGRKNWFYRMARMAQHGEPEFSYHKMDAIDAVEAGIIKYQEVAGAKRMLPDNVYRELYLAIPSDDGGNPFGLSHIKACVGELSDEMPFACGVDLAKSVDWTVVHALDRAGNTCGHERWQSPWAVTTPRLVSLLGQIPTLADATGVGDPIVEQLQAENRRLEGIKFGSANKQELMVGLASAIQNREVTYPEGVIVDELECFEYVYTRTGVRYSAPEGYHDDCVIALALAVEMRRRLNPNIKASEPAGPVGASSWAETGEDDDLEGGDDGAFSGLV